MRKEKSESLLRAIYVSSLQIRELDLVQHRKWDSLDSVTVMYKLNVPKAHIIEEQEDFGFKRTLARIQERYYWVSLPIFASL